MAEYERSLIAERMRRGRLQKYQAGSLLPWTHPPYGYRVDPARPRDPMGVRLEPSEAAIVAEIFASYLQEGQSLIGVTKQLMAQQMKSPSGRRRWNSGQCAGHCGQSGLHGNGLHRTQSCHACASAVLAIGPDRAWAWRTYPHRARGVVAVAQVPAIVS